MFSCLIPAVREHYILVLKANSADIHLPYLTVPCISLNKVSVTNYSVGKLSEYVTKHASLCTEKIYADGDVMLLIRGEKKLFNPKNITCFSIYGMEVLSLHFSSLNKIVSFLHISTCSASHKFIFFENSNHVTCHVDYILK